MKRSRLLALTLILPTTLALTACGNDISRNLDDRREQYAESSMEQVFGGDFKDFYVQCPGVTGAEASTAMDMESDDIEENSEEDPKYQYVYLRGSDNALEVKSVKRDDTDLCGTFESSKPEAFSTESTESTDSADAPASAENPPKQPKAEYAGWLKADTPLTFRKPERHEPWQLDTKVFNETVKTEPSHTEDEQADETTGATPSETVQP